MERRFFCDGKPIQSTLGLTNGDFKLCGAIMAMSILQGGPAPNFMETSIATYLVGSMLHPQDNKNKYYQTLCENVSTHTSYYRYRSFEFNSYSPRFADQL